MKRLSLIFVGLAICAFATADDLRAQIEAMGKTMHTVMMKKDIDLFVKTVKGGMTKDFKYSEAGHATSFDQMVAGMRQGFAAMGKVTSADSHLFSLTEKGNTATAKTHHALTAVTLDAKKKKHKLGFSGTSMETYRKEHGKWMMSSMTWLDQQMTMDGKKMPSAARG